MMDGLVKAAERRRSPTSSTVTPRAAGNSHGMVVQ